MATTPVDLYAFGNSTKPRSPRRNIDVFPDLLGMVGLESPPLPQGASAFGDVAKGSLTGHYFVLPAGTQLPPGLDVFEDNRITTHHAIFPDQRMRWDDFLRLFESLPWQYVGKKK